MSSRFFLPALLALGLASAVHASPDQRVRSALREAGLKYDMDEDGDFKLEFDVGGGRTQLVWINNATNQWNNMEIREVFAYGYRGEDPLGKPAMLQLLQENARKKAGAWEIIQSGDTWIASFNIKVSADCDADCLETVVKGAASTADEMEQNLMEGDDL